MNIFELGKAIIENYFFMRALTRHIGEPVYFSEEECQKVFKGIENDLLMSNRFAVAANIKIMDVIWHFNVDKFFKYNKPLTLQKYFFKVHPEYLTDYIRWGQASYMYALEIKDYLQPFKQMTRITLPLKLKDGKYYWVLQEAMPLQFDENKNIISNINLYTILRPFEKKEELPFVGYIWDDGFKHEEWTKVLWKIYFTRQPFVLSTEQNRIVELLAKNPNYTNIEIANSFGKQKNTIDIQNKQILAKARQSFPNHPFDSVRDVVRFLADMKLLESQIKPEDMEW